MKLEKHLITTGGAGERIHRFLDHFYRYFNRDHRVILHHQEGVILVGRLYGHDAIPIAKEHILDDWEGCSLPQGPNDMNFYRPVWANDLHDFMEAWKFANEFLNYWRGIKIG